LKAAKKNGKDAFDDSVWRPYLCKFYEAQYGKCAFCEVHFPSGYVTDIEHYRPKACVDNGNGKKSGYWWLAYEWKNYLYACAWCNRKHKKNQFPVQRCRATRPGKETDEKPLLLNPYDTDPALHLDFDSLGTIVGVTTEGQASIRVCGLDRQDLTNQRQTTGERITRHINDYLLHVESNCEYGQERALEELFYACHETSPFAGMARRLVLEVLAIDYSDFSSLANSKRWTPPAPTAAASP
jgi:hypothetical protein